MMVQQTLVARALLRYLLFGLSLLLSLPAEGQVPYNFYGPGQGLSDNLVTDIQKDSVGFLWIATSNGLNRFDGYTFQVFSPSTPSPGKLSARYISAIDWTRDKKLLVVYQNNIDFFELFDPKTFAVEKVNLYPANGVKGNVQIIKADETGEVYVLSQLINAIHIYRHIGGDTLSLAAEIPNEGSRLMRIDNFLPLPGGSFLINDLTHGLYLYHKDKGKCYIQYDKYLTDSLSFTGSTATTILQYSPHRDLSYIGFEENPHLFTYDHHTDSLQLMKDLNSMPTKEATYLWEDQQGNLLLSQTNGEGIYPISEHLLFIPSEGSPEDWTFLTQVTKYIVSLYSENFKDILFFGADTGLKTHYNTRFRQKNFLAQDLAIDEFGAVMRGITSDEDSIIFLAREFSYWYQLNEHTGELDTIFIRQTPDGSPLDFKCSFDLLFAPPNSLWGIACNGQGEGILIHYDTKKKTSRIFEYDNRFQDLVRGPDRAIWLIASSSPGKSVLIQFDQMTNEFKEYRTSEGKNPFQRYQLNCIVQDKEEQLWIGTNRGLLRFSAKENQLDIFTREEKLLSDNIQTISIDQHNQLWVGTSDGVTILDQYGAFVRNYTTDQALANNNASAVTEDQQGNIWVSTNNGLSVLTPGAEEFRSYYYTDGFPSNNFVSNSAFVSHNGYLYLGTVNGFTRFKPEELLYQIDLPAPQFSSIARYDIETDSTKLACYTRCLDEAIQIEPEDDYLDLSFFLPYYQAPEKNAFRIKMSPLENEWNEVDTRHTFRYQRIPPGNYTIYLQGSAPSGQWASEVAKINIQVLPHWYETIWAYAGLITLISILVYLAFLYRLRQKLKVARLRTKISSDIHDEVSGLLSGIAMQSDLLIEGTDSPTQKKRLQNIGQVSRKAVSQIHDVLWSIDSRKDYMEDLINHMQEHAEDILLPLNIFFDFQKVNIDPRKRLRVIVRQSLFFIYKEAINNVAKHSNASKVTIHLERQKNEFTMTIKDNGTSQVNNSGGSSGQGLRNMHMRAKRINAKLSTSAENGYQVQLHVPRF